MATTEATTARSTRTKTSDGTGAVRPAILVAAGLLGAVLAVRAELADERARGVRSALERALKSGDRAALAAAASAIEPAALASPDDPRLHAALGEALSGPVEPDGRTPPSGEPFDARGEAERAERALARALSIDPLDARAHVLRGFALARLDREEESDRELSLAVRAAPAHPGVARAVAEHLLFVAIERGDEESIRKSRAAVTRLARLDPASLERTLALLAPFAARLTDLEDVVPPTWEAGYHYARFLTTEGYWEDGLDAFRAAAARAGERGTFLAHATVDFSRHLAKLGRFPQALEALDEATRLAGGSCPEPLLLGRVLLNLGRKDEAEEIYFSTLRRGLGRQERLEEICGHFADAGLVAESVPFLERLHRDIPFFYAPLLALGRAFLALGDERKAERALEEFVQHDRDPRAFEELYRISARSGQWRSASDYIRKALLYAPANENYAALLEEAEEKARGAG